MHHTEKPKPNRLTNIDISSEYHQEKAGYPRTRRKRKYRATQDAQDKLKIFQDQVIVNERAIQARGEESRESEGTRRKHQMSLTGKMQVISKAEKCRETRPW
jgi:hypothetical protein